MEKVRSKEIRMILPDSSAPVTLPKGWSLGPVAGPAVTVVCPEGDLRVAFLIRPLEGAPEEIARSAWKIFDNTFDFPVQQKIAIPWSAGDGWDDASEVIYNLPVTQSRAAVAELRMLGAKVYCTLALGAAGSWSRRWAQIMEMLENWKPEGLHEPSLAGLAPRKWGKTQSSKMSDFLRSSMEALHIPGAAIAVVQGGHIVFAEGFGVRGIGSGQPVQPDTPFMIGSSTKSLTTLMMARLVAMGNFDWSTPVTELLPDFALADPDLTRKLEMRHTASASTGMPCRDMELIFKFKDVTPEQRLAEMKHMKPTTGLGETFQYSNYMVAVGGYAAARSFRQEGSLQEAYEHAMRELVFEPLGMRMSGFYRADGALTALPHAVCFEGNVVSVDPALERFGEPIAPSGACWSTVADVARYLLLELNRGKLHDGKQLLPESVLVERRKRATKITDRLSYGLDLLRGEEDGLDVISHGGMTFGFTSDMYFLPQNDLGVILLTNLAGAGSFLMAARRKVFELVFGAPARAGQMIEAASLAKKEAVASSHARVKVDAVSVACLKAIVGDYQCSELGVLTVRERDGQYDAQFDSWSTVLGVEKQPNGSPAVVLLGPPIIDEPRLQVTDNGWALTLAEGQQVYKFERR